MEEAEEDDEGDEAEEDDEAIGAGEGDGDEGEHRRDAAVQYGRADGDESSRGALSPGNQALFSVRDHPYTEGEIMVGT